jgi:hypothetical protein
MLGTSRENQITWNDWKELMVEILKSAAQREKQLISSRLDHIGLHKQSEETSSQLEVYRRAIIDAQAYYEQRIDSIAGKAFHHEQKLLRDFIKVESYNKKNTVKEWNNLYLELSNERGPWGTGMVDESNVSSICTLLTFLFYRIVLTVFLFFFFSLFAVVIVVFLAGRLLGWLISVKIIIE